MDSQESKDKRTAKTNQNVCVCVCVCVCARARARARWYTLQSEEFHRSAHQHNEVAKIARYFYHDLGLLSL